MVPAAVYHCVCVSTHKHTISKLLFLHYFLQFLNIWNQVRGVRDDDLVAPQSPAEISMSAEAVFAPHSCQIDGYHHLNCDFPSEFDVWGCNSWIVAVVEVAVGKEVRWTTDQCVVVQNIRNNYSKTIDVWSLGVFARACWSLLL